MQKEDKDLLKGKKMGKEKVEYKLQSRYQGLLSKFNINIKDFEWHKFYSLVSGKESMKYINELLYYSKIEPFLNQSIMFPALEDKNLLDLFISPELLPKIFIKNQNGFYFHNGKLINFDKVIQVCMEQKQFVIKPSIGTYSGTGVKKVNLSFQGKDKKSHELVKILNDYDKNFVIQEVLEQNEIFAKPNKSSVNTVRIMTYLNELNKSNVLSAVFRIGKKGSFTDNTGTGGVVCGISSKGQLGHFATDSFGNNYDRTEDGYHFKEQLVLPQFKEIIKTVEREHLNIPYFRLISWDVTIDKFDNVRIIEFNAMGQEINFHQSINGPLFGEFTDSIFEQLEHYDPLYNLLKFGKN